MDHMNWQEWQRRRQAMRPLHEQLEAAYPRALGALSRWRKVRASAGARKSPATWAAFVGCSG